MTENAKCEGLCQWLGTLARVDTPYHHKKIVALVMECEARCQVMTETFLEVFSKKILGVFFLLLVSKEIEVC